MHNGNSFQYNTYNFNTGEKKTLSKKRAGRTKTYITMTLSCLLIIQISFVNQITAKYKYTFKDKHIQKCIQP